MKADRAAAAISRMLSCRGKGIRRAASREVAAAATPVSSMARPMISTAATTTTAGSENPCRA